LEKNLLIQIHWTDLDGYSKIIKGPTDSLINEAKELFDKIVLVCADVPENIAVAEYAERIGVDCFKGSEQNVLLRFKDCMQKFEMKTAARILIYWFMVDLNFLIECLKALDTSGDDYVFLPRDFDVKFAADVFSYSFLEKSENFLANVFDGDGRGRYLFCPWALTETYPEIFSFMDAPRVPVYGEEKFLEIRKLVDEIYPERAPVSEVSDYIFAASFLSEDAERVADIACGYGYGTAYLATVCKDVVGVDYEEDLIAISKKKHGGQHVEFLTGDVSNPDLFEGGSLDAIVSMHSMEHFQDDELFLRNCAGWLKPSGRMVLEVPLLLKYPFAHAPAPLGADHIREYTREGLLNLCEKFFKVENVYGVARGLYLAPEMARNAVLVVLSNSRKPFGVAVKDG
jgi:2-polyprenyl-3-methyl-5-hydroxy-6-metoxy-1,4-benzoquinol methylase